MGNSLGDYNIARSSSNNIKNIKSSQRKPTDPDKPKNKKKKNTSPTNIIYSSKPSIKSDAKKMFKIKINDTVKSKNNEETRKKFLNSSSSNYIIKPGFKRPGR
ncbi:MAG: hypothetical protein PVI88_06375 [Nitrosopumilaceae archaeon]|jgi:hypothetical protein